MFKWVSKTVEGFSKKNPKKFQGYFDEVLVLQFCWCMDLITATRAEGGLVSVELAS